MIGLEVETVKKGKAGTNDLPRIKLGSRVLFSLHAVQRWMERKAREAEEEKRRQEMAVIDLVAEKKRRQKLVRDAYTNIINGGSYSR